MVLIDYGHGFVFVTCVGMFVTVYVVVELRRFKISLQCFSKTRKLSDRCAKPGSLHD